jgi:hypothetical protein
VYSEETSKPLVYSTVPGYEEPKLLQMMQGNALVSDLIRCGASVETLQQHEISLDDFYKHGYSLADVHAIVGDFDQLLQYGFTRQHVTVPWYLDQLCTLYNKPKLEVCSRLGFRAEDFVRAFVTPREMADFGITAETLRTNLGLNFGSLYSMNIRFDEFATLFDLTVDSLKALNLNEAQKRALSAHRGWTPATIKRRFDLGYEELADVWFNLDLE